MRKINLDCQRQHTSRAHRKPSTKGFASERLQTHTQTHNLHQDGAIAQGCFEALARVAVPFPFLTKLCSITVKKRTKGTVIKYGKSGRCLHQASFSPGEGHTIYRRPASLLSRQCNCPWTLASCTAVMEYSLLQASHGSTNVNAYCPVVQLVDRGSTACPLPLSPRENEPRQGAWLCREAV